MHPYTLKQEIDALEFGQRMCEIADTVFDFLVEKELIIDEACCVFKKCLDTIEQQYRKTPGYLPLTRLKTADNLTIVDGVEMTVAEKFQKQATFLAEIQAQSVT